MNEPASSESAIAHPFQLRLLVPLWLAATLLVDAACLASVAAMSSWQFNLLTATLCALAFSQISLAAIWTALGAGLFVLRFVAAIAVAGVWLGLLSLVGPNATELLGLLALQMVCVCGPLLLARAFGIRLTRGDRTPINHRPLQFGIAHILVWTTVVALLLGLARVVPWPTDLATRERELMLGPIFATLALLAVWAALGTSYIGLRLIVLLLASPLLGLGAYAMLTPPQSSQENLLEFSLMTGLQGVLLAGSLWIFRLGGYRLTRKSKIAAQ